MKFRLFLLFLILQNSICFCQNISKKELHKISFPEDVDALDSIGFNRFDIEFIKILSIENENQFLTVEGYRKNISKYRKLKDYKLIEKIFSHSRSYERKFPDVLSIQTDYKKGLEKADIEKKQPLIIFASHVSINCRLLQDAIISGAFENIHKKYVILWLYVDNINPNGINEYYKLENEVYKSDYQPCSITMLNGKMSKKFEGFAISDLKKYRKFLK